MSLKRSSSAGAVVGGRRVWSHYSKDRDPTRKTRKSAEHHPWIVFMKLYLAKKNRGRAPAEHVRYFKVLKEAAPKYKALLSGIVPLDKKEFGRAERQKHLCDEIRSRFDAQVEVTEAQAQAGGARTRTKTTRRSSIH